MHSCTVLSCKLLKPKTGGKQCAPLIALCFSNLHTVGRSKEIHTDTKGWAPDIEGEFCVIIRLQSPNFFSLLLPCGLCPPPTPVLPGSHAAHGEPPFWGPVTTRCPLGCFLFVCLFAMSILAEMVQTALSPQGAQGS